MRQALTVLLFLVATFLASGTAARRNELPPANRRNFVACPIVRDTKTLPCWLAEQASRHNQNCSLITRRRLI